MCKPQPKQGILAFLDKDGKKFYSQNELFDAGRNQGIRESDAWILERLEDIIDESFEAGEFHSGITSLIEEIQKEQK